MISFRQGRPTDTSTSERNVRSAGSEPRNPTPCSRCAKAYASLSRTLREPTPLISAADASDVGTLYIERSPSKSHPPHGAHDPEGTQLCWWTQRFMEATSSVGPPLLMHPLCSPLVGCRFVLVRISALLPSRSCVPTAPQNALAENANSPTDLVAIPGLTQTQYASQSKR